MKLVAAVIASLVSLTTLARADEYSGPPGNYGQPIEAPRGDQARPPEGQRGFVEPARFAPAQPRGPRGQLRQMILQRFDRNHDGRLEPNERRQAARALRRIARQLARGGQPGRLMREQVIDRYDLNGDGNVGPGEMPPAMAKRLRRLDRNGDGWVDDRDFAP